MYLSLFLILLIPKYYIINNSIIINHIVLPTSPTEKYDYVRNYFDEKMSVLIQHELDNLKKNEILLKNIHQPGSNNRSTLYENYASQAENIWTKINEGKK